jgi:predicted O-methyltransferase YrrM
VLSHRDAMVGVEIHEGSICQPEADYLSGLVRDRGAIRVAQVGLGYGWSAWAFLSANPDLVLKSFDLGGHPAIADGSVQRVIETHFPGRHTVVLGDSRVTLLEDRASYDLVFIDGGHDVDTALADLINLSSPGCVVVIDDLDDGYPGVQRAWEAMKVTKAVWELARFTDGSHGWAIGVYG